ncbi:MAG TPA: CxxxxCH/CxxCH domain-containing protein [Nitrospirota bacterium]|nr:CxxxxCH/CxxCH domain-containing protein [Nitrospirota bacterium]
MSPIRKMKIAIPLLFMGLLITAGCSGKGNASSPFDADSGQHPVGWLPSGHATAAKANEDSCMGCHGSDLSGGITGVSCLSCHVNGSPFTLTDCTSCHGNPPNGNASPNTTGAHDMRTGHFAPSVILPDGCNTCHNGAGSGTTKHDNGTVDVSLMSLYSSHNGTATYNNGDGTCSNVSCHGGQTTPNWMTGFIDVTTQCTQCHFFGTAAGTPEYNSFWSGKHDLHVNTENISCFSCHETSKLTLSHFVTLNTLTMEGPASATINDLLNYTNHTCAAACHVSRDWFAP